MRCCVRFCVAVLLRRCVFLTPKAKMELAFLNQCNFVFDQNQGDLEIRVLKLTFKSNAGALSNV